MLLEDTLSITLSEAWARDYEEREQGGAEQSPSRDADAASDGRTDGRTDAVGLCIRSGEQQCGAHSSAGQQTRGLWNDLS